MTSQVDKFLNDRPNFWQPTVVGGMIDSLAMRAMALQFLRREILFLCVRGISVSQPWILADHFGCDLHDRDGGGSGADCGWRSGNGVGPDFRWC